jgi:hypothetical protein
MMYVKHIPRDVRDNPSGFSRRAIFIAGKDGVTTVDPGEWARRTINEEDLAKSKGKTK